MANYIKFSHIGKVSTGILKDEKIEVCTGSLFEKPQLTGQNLSLGEVEILPPCAPTKFLALWNNFYSRAEKEGWQIPSEPLYFVKTANSWSGHGQPIQLPKSYQGGSCF